MLEGTEKDAVDQIIQKALDAIKTLTIKQKRYLEAEKICQQAITIQPDNQILRCKLQELKCHTNPDDALKMLFEDLEKDPQNATIMNNIATAYSHKKERQSAIQWAEKACQTAVHPQFWNNLGMQYQHIGRVDDAIKAYNISLQLDKNPDILTNLGNAYGMDRQFDKALGCYKEILKDYNEPETKVNMAYVYFLCGQHKKAWRLYENRLEVYDQSLAYMQLYGKDKKWDGKANLDNKTVVVFCEQGMGDAIQFCRYIKYLKKRYNCKIILNCNEPLHRLLEQIKEVDEIIEKNIHLIKKTNYDYHIPLLSLPLFLDKTGKQTGKPYLKANTKDLGGGKKIGISWKGNPDHPDDYHRSCPIEVFRNLLKIKGVEFYNLCKDTKIKGIHNPKLTDFLSTAEIINGLDLVISVDTSILHLAGALGKPTWGLLAFRNDWRWGIESEKTHWYESVRLFRQEKAGDWEGLIERVKYAIQF